MANPFPSIALARLFQTSVLALRTVQLKACDAGKATDVAKLLQEAKEANDPVRGTATVGRVEVTSYETLYVRPKLYRAFGYQKCTNSMQFKHHGLQEFDSHGTKTIGI